MTKTSNSILFMIRKKKERIERDGILFVMEGKKKIEAEKQIQKWLREIKLLK